MQVKRLVEVYLERDPKARNSDNWLIYLVWSFYLSKMGLDINTMYLPNVLLNMDEYGLPSFETIRRTRQRCQETHPEWAASDRVKQNREEMKEEYLEIARS